MKGVNGEGKKGGKVECCSISIRFITITGAGPIVGLENNYYCCQTNTW